MVQCKDNPKHCTTWWLFGVTNNRRRKMSYQTLTVGNNIFDITQQIEQADPAMMLRELVDNAITAAAQAQKGIVKFIKFDPNILGLDDYNENKIAIWNNGVGLDSTFLQKMTNIASCINKNQSLKGNYGKGAKIASLSSNRVGMIYISCRDKKVHYLIIGQVTATPQGDPVYGRFDLSGKGNCIADCTDEMLAAGYNINEDWTMVVLCGNKVKQDTINEPFGNKITNAWAFNDVYTRFFKIPHNVELRFEVGHSKGKAASPLFKPISEYIPDKAKNNPDKMKQEWVSINQPELQGIRVWYIWDGPWGESETNEGKPTSTIGNPATRAMFGGIVYKGETYAITEGSTWKVDASYMGILAGSNHLRIFVELPDDFQCQPDLYRTDLEITVESEGRKKKDRLSIRNFSELIHNNRPKWFIEKCREYDTAKGASNDAMNKLSALLSRLSLKQTQKQQVPYYKSIPNMNNSSNTTVNGTNIPGVHSNTKKKNNTNLNTGGNQSGKSAIQILSSKFKKVEVIKKVPNIKCIWSDEELEKYNISQYRAGNFQRTTNDEVMYVNCRSRQYNDIKNDIENKLRSGIQDPAIDITDEAKQFAADWLIWKVGSTVIRALAQENRDGWSSTDVEKILTPENLTVAADAWEEDIGSLTTEINALARKKKMERPNPDVITNGANALTTKAKAEFGEKYKAPITQQ